MTVINMHPQEERPLTPLEQAHYDVWRMEEATRAASSHTGDVLSLVSFLEPESLVGITAVTRRCRDRLDEIDRRVSGYRQSMRPSWPAR